MEKYTGKPITEIIKTLKELKEKVKKKRINKKIEKYKRHLKKYNIR